MKQPIEPDYLGDGVYATGDAFGGVWLFANDYKNPTDRIYLEPQVFDSLKRYSERLNQNLREVRGEAN